MNTADEFDYDGYESPQSRSSSNQPEAPLYPCQKYNTSSLGYMPLDGSYEDGFYQSIVYVLTKTLSCGSEHGNRMVAGLAVTVLFRYQNGDRQECLKYVIIDRICKWTKLSRLNASKIAYLSFKIYNNRSHPAYVQSLGEWEKNIVPTNSFLAEVTKIALWWKSSFPKKFSFYQIQMAAAEIEKTLKKGKELVSSQEVGSISALVDVKSAVYTFIQTEKDRLINQQLSLLTTESDLLCKCPQTDGIENDCNGSSNDKNDNYQKLSLGYLLN